MKLENESVGLTFDDVLLVPQYSEVKSRADVDLSMTGPLGKLCIPFLSANMDTVTESAMAVAMLKAGGRGVFHRFMPRNKFDDEFLKYNAADRVRSLIASVGVGEEAKETVKYLTSGLVKAPAICIDVAHGHSLQMLEMIRFIKSHAPHVTVIAGNVATQAGTQALAEAGADIIKVGIGPGSLCSTRIVTGHGVPQLTAIQECAEQADYYSSESGRPIQIIADGGIRNSGDVAKALAAGADYVMLGSLLAATDEAPGAVINIDGIPHKQYRGMASKEVQEQLGKQVAAEGVSQNKPCKGPVANILHELEWGLRSALTYSGARNIQEFRDKSVFRRVSSHGYVEGTPHGLHALHT